MSGKEKIKYLVRRRSAKYILFVLIALLAITGMYMFAIANQLTGLIVTPDPFKLGTNAYIQYTLGQDANVTINVFKENGDHVKTLLNNIKKYSGFNSQSWDGKDQNGVLVPDGNYKLVVEAKDAAGTQVGLAEVTFMAARQPAISGVTDAPDPFNPSNGEQSTIQFTVSSGHIQKVTILKGYEVVRTWNTTQEVKAPGTYTWNWDGKDNNGNIVGDGIYTYQIEATSPMVSSFKSTYKGTVNVEKEAPKVTAITTTPNPLKISSGSMTVAYTLSENAKVTMKIMDAAGNTVKTILNAISKNAGYNSSAWDGKDAAGAYVAEGTYTVVINAVDNFSNSSGDQSVTVKAGYLPAITGAAANPTSFNPAIAQSNISYSISKNSLVTVQIFNGYNSVRTIVDKQSQTAGDNSVPWDGKDDAGQIVGDGNYTYQITAVSAVVDTFSSTAKGTVTVEMGAPSVTGLTLSPNPYKLGAGNLTIGYTLSENAAVDIVILKGTDVVRNLDSGLSKNAGYNSGIWDGKDNAGSVVGEGTYSVRVKAVDPSGNAGEATADVTAGYQPSISNASHTPDPYDPGTGSVNFKFDLNYSAKVTVTIMKGTLPVRTISANILAPGNNNVVWDGKDDAARPIADGTYNYQIDAVSPVVDFFKSTYKGSILVEGSAPALTDLTVSPLIVKIGSSTTFRYTLSEAAAVTAQILTKTGTVVRDFAVETKTASGYYSFAWDNLDNQNNLIGSGDYIFKVSAIDNAAKTGTAELAFQAGAIPELSGLYADPAVVNVTTKGGGQTTIYYNLSERSYVTIKIFDANGTLARTLSAFQDTAAGAQSAVWDCKNEKGQVVGGTLTYKIDATSVIGYFKAAQASGTVQVTGAIGGTSNCAECHTGYPASHQMSNCAGCHGNNEPIASIHTGTEDCASCHVPHDTANLVPYDCGYCHSVDYSDKIPVHPANETELHTSATLDMINCGTCHQADVTKEHTNCWTCHSSSDQVVLGSMSTGNTQCSSCHRVQHNTNFAETVPVDIPVYDAVYGGMTWTPPRDAFLWAGESWMPADFVNGGRVIMSDRHTDLSGEAVYTYYTTQMAANGWTVAPHAQVVSDFFSLSFTKGERQAVVWFFGGENHSASSPLAASGYKVEIIYK